MKRLFTMLFCTVILCAYSCSGGSSKPIDPGFGDGRSPDVDVFQGGSDAADLPDVQIKEIQDLVDARIDTPQPDSTDAGDLGATDSDVFVLPCDPGEGCFMDKCDRPESCISGWCVEHVGEGVCTTKCQEDCSPGWTCKQVSTGGSDFDSICVSNFPSLCKPCVTSADCETVTGEKVMCLDLGTEGRFCGGPCAAGDKCISGFECIKATSVDGIESKQCVPKSGKCGCTDRSIAYSLFTICLSEENQWGVCAGKRVCGEGGLSACDASKATFEICNGLDDDCDNVADNNYFDGDTLMVMCDDNDPCTLDLCRGKEGCTNIPQTEQPCDDGDPCTQNDLCRQGLCQGQDMECDDKNACTDDFCDHGSCKSVWNNLACDDGNPCTGQDKCVNGACTGVEVPCGCTTNADCDELGKGDPCNGYLKCDLTQNPARCVIDPTTIRVCPPPAGPNYACLQPSCDPFTGSCGFVPAREGLFCDDMDKCDDGDRCTAGVCGGGTPVNCDDGNQCTTDTCSAESGCAHANVDKACDDGNPCTEGDWCLNGQCKPGQPKACDDGRECTADSCDPASGCVHQKLGGIACDDKDACTTGETCAAGECGGGSLVVCDDLNFCTKDWCDKTAGCKTSNDDGKVCDDKNNCTTNDKCSGGSCKGAVAFDCDDKNMCTKDSCALDGTCLHENLSGVSCDDGDPCTVSDRCEAGVCKRDPLVCEDGNVCTSGACVTGVGCKYSPLSGTCDDGRTCTRNDICSNGVCAGTPVDCNDSNSCTRDACVEGVGCFNEKLSDLACDDGSLCTKEDKCVNGVCTGTIVQDCDDKNPCTVDLCLAGGLCDHRAADGVVCEDGNPCTLDDRCQDLLCVPDTHICDDGNPCTDGQCNGAAGCAFTKLDAVPCDDGKVCTTTSACVEGTCTGKVRDCDDSNVCTKDTCDELSGGCVNAPIAGLCDDGSVCSVTDSCLQGKCAPGTPLVCDDKNQCTDDTCDPKDGCQYKARTGGCDDGSACTVGDQCVDGTCTAGTPLICEEDANICTKAACDNVKGCIQAPADGECDDGNVCTASDSCQNGVCTGGGKLQCPEDANPCTDAACDPGMGCIQQSNTAACSDNDSCTEGDKCANGVCLSGTPVVCKDDNNVCTSQACEPAKGCVVTNLDGVKCGTQANEFCKNGVCSCIGNCTGKVCGDDGCGGTCGTCPNDPICSTVACVAGACKYTVNIYYCLINNFCVPSGALDPTDSCRICWPATNQLSWTSKADNTVCGLLPGEHCWGGTCCNPTTNCTGKQCGDDRCGGSCGTCADPQHGCISGLCGHIYATLPYSTGFEGVGYDPSWRLEASDNATLAVDAGSVTNTPHGGTKMLYSKKTSAQANAAGSSRAMLHLNCEGKDNVVLSYWWKAVTANEVMTTEDGLSISLDGGVTWRDIDFHDKDFGTGNPAANTWYFRKLNLSAAAHLGAFSLTSKTVLRFRHQALSSNAMNAGIALDDVSVAVAAYSTLPQAGGFEETGDLLPSSLSWAGTLQGRVRAAGGAVGYVHGGAQALQFDSLDTTNGADSEARISLNLSGETYALLTFWWTEYGELEDDDGVFLSADGGKTFSKVFAFPASAYTNGQWRFAMMDLAGLSKTFGLSLSSTFVVMIKAKTRNTTGAAGYSIDDVKVRRSPVYQNLPYSNGFESSDLDDGWYVTYTNGCRVRFTGENGAKEGSSYLQFDRDPSLTTAGTVLGQAYLYLNLANQVSPYLELWWMELADEPDPEDGVFISVDGGKTFSSLFQLKGAPTGIWNHSLVDLAKLAGGLNLTLSATTVLKFQNKSNASVPTDGIAFDSISVVTSNATIYRTLPAAETFSNGAVPSGFSYYGSRSGRVTNPSINGNPVCQLDSSVANQWGDNELNLNLNLTGIPKALLRFRIRDYAETSQDWDGLWLSDNGGASFAKVHSFNYTGMTDGAWNNQHFELDRLARDNGLSLSGKFVVSFRQSDNNLVPARGIVLDQIKVVVPAYVTSYPYYTGFETQSGEMDAYWSCLSTSSGRCLVGGLTYSPFQGSWVLVMDAATVAMSTNSALLRLNLAGTTGSVSFQMQVKGFNEELTADEGVFISDNDGKTWSRVRSFFTGSLSLPANYALWSFNVTDEATYYGLNPKSSTFLIMIQQIGDQAVSNDGTAVDEVRVEELQ